MEMLEGHIISRDILLNSLLPINEIALQLVMDQY
jgi:hypothetical protein